jgi:hypothetical protein
MVVVYIVLSFTLIKRRTSIPDRAKVSISFFYIYESCTRAVLVAEQRIWLSNFSSHVTIYPVKRSELCIYYYIHGISFVSASIPTVLRSACVKIQIIAVRIRSGFSRPRAYEMTLDPCLALAAMSCLRIHQSATRRLQRKNPVNNKNASEVRGTKRKKGR